MNRKSKIAAALASNFANRQLALSRSSRGARGATKPLADSPSHAHLADVFNSPDDVARPKRMAIVKGEVEFLGNVFGRNGIETNTSAKRV